MSESAKNKAPLWYGYMEAGDKSTAVIRDDRLDTGTRKTVFLFNLKRKEIIEYTREIVQPKLRELDTSERNLIAELDAAYAEAQRQFKNRNRSLNIPERGGQAAEKPQETKNESFEGYDSDNEDAAWVDGEEEEET